MTILDVITDSGEFAVFNSHDLSYDNQHKISYGLREAVLNLRKQGQYAIIACHPIICDVLIRTLPEIKRVDGKISLFECRIIEDVHAPIQSIYLLDYPYGSEHQSLYTHR